MMVTSLLPAIASAPLMSSNHSSPHLESCSTRISLLRPSQRLASPTAAAEFESFPSLIFGTLVEQPKWQRINGEKAYIWCHGGIVKFSISEGYEVNDGCVLAAERVEQALSALALERVDPPVDRPHCVCPKFYPQYFS